MSLRRSAGPNQTRAMASVEIRNRERHGQLAFASDQVSQHNKFQVSIGDDNKHSKVLLEAFGASQAPWNVFKIRMEKHGLSLFFFFFFVRKHSNFNRI